MGGVLGGISKVAEGVDIISKETQRMAVETVGWKMRGGKVGRRRLPRCIRGDRKLRPFEIRTAVGLALLQQACAAPSSLLAGAIPLPGTAAAATQALNLRQDSYEVHFVLPHDMVAVLTNARVLLVRCPGFAEMESQVVGGTRPQVRGSRLHVCRQPCLPCAAEL